MEKIIGVIGGMGPYAGIDLVRKIFDLTTANKDKDHLPVALLSFPEWIRDRSTFLFENTGENPAEAIAEIALRLDRIGAVVAGIPCNTAHAPAIYDVVEERLREKGARLRLIHMIRETASYIREEVEGVQRIGILSTLAVYKLGLYRSALADAGFDPVLPDEDVQLEMVNRTIFDPTYGIKAQANPVSREARRSLLDAIEHLQRKGAEAVVLGCTELPLAIEESEIGSTIIIDPTEVLAKALIRETYPERLKSSAVALGSKE
ncbi:MAG: amino acid racemase [Rhodothermales bacterium]